MNEAETRAELIDPVLRQAGWGVVDGSRMAHGDSREEALQAANEALDGENLDAVRDELADVQIYLLRLADRPGVDLLAAVERKIEKNERKYPVDRARGNARKYTDL